MRDRWLWIGIVFLTVLMLIGLGTGNDRLVGNAIGGLFLGLVLGVGAWLIRAIKGRGKTESEPDIERSLELRRSSERMQNGKR
jgi:hypothetical protein